MIASLPYCSLRRVEFRGWKFGHKFCRLNGVIYAEAKCLKATQNPVTSRLFRLRALTSKRDSPAQFYVALWGLQKYPFWCLNTGEDTRITIIVTEGSDVFFIFAFIPFPVFACLRLSVSLCLSLYVCLSLYIHTHAHTHAQTLTHVHS